MDKSYPTNKFAIKTIVHADTIYSRDNDNIYCGGRLHEAQ